MHKKEVLLWQRYGKSVIQEVTKKNNYCENCKKSKQKPKEGNQFGSGNSGIQTPTGSKSKPKRNTSRHKGHGKEVLKKHYRTRCSCKENYYCYI